MRIAFICTSLQPGRDGVGDYTRQLAAACAERGHECRLFAINDRHLATSIEDDDGCVRFASTEPWPNRIAALASALRDFAPDWVSWQIVAYGFDPKGLMPAAAAPLAALSGGWQTHAMLHELWLGLSAGESVRTRLVGAWQRHRLLAFLRRLAPQRVHTSNETYQRVLRRCQWPAQVLPLFGNIPIAPPAAPSPLAELAPRLSPAPRTIGVMFGTLHAQWRARETFSFLRAAAADTHRSISLVTLGHGGPQQDAILAPVRAEFRDIPVLTLGAASPTRISQILQSADFGLSSHPWALVEKSGSTVAMLEHGLPVLVPRDEWRLRGDAASTASWSPLLRPLKGFAPSEFSTWLDHRHAPAPRLPHVVDAFLAALGDPVHAPASAA